MKLVRLFGAKNMSLKVAIASALLTIAMSPCASAAVINGPTYPAAGGNTFNSTGSSIDAGGLNGSYTLTDTSAYTTQWWSLAVSSPYDSSFTSGAPNMTFVGEIGSSNQFLFNGAPLTFFDPQTNSDVSLSTEFILTLNSGLTYDPTASGTVGAPLFQISGNSFNVNFQYLGNNGSGFTALGPLYNSYNHTCTGCLQTGTDGSFYYTNPPAATPEPASTALFGTGLVGIATIIRRRTRK